MKNLRILLFVVAASFFVACDDAIDITQPSELLPERAFETVEDLQLGLNGVYAAAPGENHIYFTSLFTDEVKLGKSNGGQGRDGGLAFLLNNNSSDAASIWVSNYALINFANRLIKGAENVTPLEGEEERYNNILAQAYALRAFGHFQLISYFSPNMADDNALGVIALDFVPPSNAQLPRNTNGEVYSLIERDLAFAEENFITVNNVATNRTYVSQDFVKALRARMGAYRTQYAVAEPFVDQLIATYPLTPKASYVTMFRDTNLQNQEVIFKLERTVTSSTGNFYQYWSSVNSTVSGSPFFEVSAALFNLFNNASDIRRSVIVDPSAAPTFTVRPVGKYSETEATKLLADIKVFRSSEMRFIKAEIEASRNNFAGVATQINAVRTARYGNASGNIGVPANAADAWAAILQERRIELAFEGHRYVDLRRLGAKAGVSVDRSAADCAFNNACTLPIDDHRWTLPIPRPEQAANPGIQQNPGYN